MQSKPQGTTLKDWVSDAANTGEPKEDGSALLPIQWLDTQALLLRMASDLGKDVPCTVEVTGTRWKGGSNTRWSRWSARMCTCACLCAFCVFLRGSLRRGVVFGCMQPSVLTDKWLSSKHEICVILQLFPKISALLGLMLQLRKRLELGKFVLSKQALEQGGPL